MSYELRCGVCGESFQPDGITLQMMIVQRGDLLCHMEPCSIDARLRAKP